MTKASLSGQDAEEYKRLYIEYGAAIERAVTAIRTAGMESEEFRQADADAGRLWSRLRELQGMGGKHWMA